MSRLNDKTRCRYCFGSGRLDDECKEAIPVPCDDCSGTGLESNISSEKLMGARFWITFWALLSGGLIVAAIAADCRWENVLYAFLAGACCCPLAITVELYRRGVWR